MSSEVSVVGTIFSPVTAVVGVGVAIAEAAAGTAKTISETAKLIAADKRIEEAIREKYKETCIKEESPDKRAEYIERVIEAFSESALISKERARSLIMSAPERKRVEVAFKLLDLEARYKMVIENLGKLTDLAERLDIDSVDIIEMLGAFKDDAESLSADKLEERLGALSEAILARIEENKSLIEEKIRERVIEAEAVEFKRTEESLFGAIFRGDIADILDNPPEAGELRDLIDEKSISEYRIRAYAVISVLKGMEGFEKYAEEILALYSSIEELSERDDMSLEDYKYQVGLKQKSLDAILARLEGEEEYKRKMRFTELVAVSNVYRKELGLEEIEVPYENSEEQIRTLEEEKATLEERYIGAAKSKRLLADLKIRYTERLYRHIASADRVVEKDGDVRHISYYITPDGRNILCISVNEKGILHEEVVGVKIDGVSEDPASVLAAQETFCKHSKEIIASLFEGDEVKTIIDEPSLEYAISKDFTGVVPAEIIEQIRENKEGKKKKLVKPSQKAPI